MTIADGRSVGDLLLECDQITRDLLEEPRTLNSAAMLRTWPEMVQAAAEFFHELPTRPHGWGSGPGVMSHADLTGERLYVLSTSLHRQLRARSWPEHGPGDERLLRVTGNLVRARDLLARHHRVGAAADPDVRADAVAARTRALHAVYVATHAVSLAIWHTPPAGHPRSRLRARQQGSLRLAQRRLEVFERVVGTEVYRRFPGALAKQWREEPSPERIAAALARWDIAAHRAMAAETRLSVLLEVTRVQAATMAISRVVLEAAADRGRVDADRFREQTSPQLVASEAAWGALHHELNELSGPFEAGIPAELRTAGSELVLGLAEVVLDGAVPASAATVALRTAPAALAGIEDSFGASSELSSVVKEALAAPSLIVSARAAQARLKARSAETWEGSPQHAWLDPQDLAADRQVPAPAPLVAQLQRQAHHLCCVTATLATIPPVHRPDAGVPAAGRLSGPAQTPSVARRASYVLR